MKIFLLNGPPRSGKDTAASFLKEEFGGQIMKFAKPLKDGCTAIYCDNDRLVFDSFDNAKYKDEKVEQFHGKSCREVQISLSEDYLKPQFGEEVFGKILANAIDNSIEDDLFFVSDSGFRPEAKVLIDKFGAKNVVLICIFREGFTFEGDSRNYVYLEDLGVKSVEIINNGSMEEFQSKIIEVVKQFKENNNV